MTTIFSALTFFLLMMATSDFTVFSNTIGVFLPVVVKIKHLNELIHYRKLMRAFLLVVSMFSLHFFHAYSYNSAVLIQC